ncbi:DUF5994 family protein [Nocardia abscessus]|uniref:DUF5994 family protein n=1 Tax=Nocardia abscessus TaxID=120957 RepID=UPI0002E825FA|nr:DUF5994 family protein [Nocardia abscessus]MCC3326147.1 DUF5994 family protein [Nocardia abscessus]
MPRIRIRRPITNHFDMSSATGPPEPSRQPFQAPTRTPRLLLRESETGPEEVDGGWWPWTDNLTAELHDLISALTPRLGHTARVSFDWNAVSLTQRRIDSQDGIAVHGPDSGQPPGTMHLIGTNGAQATLLVIPADTPPAEAENLLRRAAGKS